MVPFTERRREGRSREGGKKEEGKGGRREGGDTERIKHTRNKEGDWVCNSGTQVRSRCVRSQCRQSPRAMELEEEGRGTGGRWIEQTTDRRLSCEDLG